MAIFFDHASTTPCCEAALEAFRQFALTDFGNPSSSHIFGAKAARRIQEAKAFFAQAFRVTPEQVIFTSGGTEANNLAISGTIQAAYLKNIQPIEVITSQLEHSSVQETVRSLEAYGVQTNWVAPTSLNNSVSPQTTLVSLQQVNHVLGTLNPVEEIAAEVKKRAKEVGSSLVFHCDAVQAFGKVTPPSRASGVDLLTLSSHKIQGPKGIGALILLNPDLLRSGRLRPMLWGGGQESGIRSGTQSTGLIAAFHVAAQEALQSQTTRSESVQSLKHYFFERLREERLLNTTSAKSSLECNSPEQSIPHIINLSAHGIPSGPLSKLLEERGCLVSTGSACSSKKSEPDPVLQAQGLPKAIQTSAFRISLSHTHQKSDIDHLVVSIRDSLERASLLLGKKRK